MKLFGYEISEKIYMPILIILGGILLYIVITEILNNKIKINTKLSKHEQRSRKTVLLLVKNIIKIIIILIGIVAILQVMGVNTSALVAGVSAVTIVVGLAFQDILKDYLVGAAIIMESQYAIGEYVEINGFKGEVIYLTLRSTRLKSLSGEVKIIANRNITEVVNYSLNYPLVKIIASVSYESDVKKVESVLNDLIKKLNKEIEELKEDITLAGIDSLSTSSVDFLLTTRCSKKEEYIVRRKILKEIKIAFDKNNIKIPYPQIEVHNGK